MLSRRKDQHGRTVTLSYQATLAQPAAAAFAFVSEPATWPRFFSSIEHAERDADWGRVGGRGRMTTRFLGRPVTSQLEITEWAAPLSFRYVARHANRPELDNLRVFEPTAAGTVLRGTTTLELRGGPHWLSDRLSAWMLQRVYDRAMLRLGEVAGAVAPSLPSG